MITRKWAFLILFAVLNVVAIRLITSHKRPGLEPNALESRTDDTSEDNEQTRAFRKELGKKALDQAYHSKYFQDVSDRVNHLKSLPWDELVNCLSDGWVSVNSAVRHTDSLTRRDFDRVLSDRALRRLFQESLSMEREEAKTRTDRLYKRTWQTYRESINKFADSMVSGAEQSADGGEVGREHALYCSLFLQAHFNDVSTIFDLLNEHRDYRNAVVERLSQVEELSLAPPFFFDSFDRDPNFSIRLLNYCVEKQPTDGGTAEQRVRELIETAIQDDQYSRSKLELVAWNAKTDWHDLFSDQAQFAPLELDRGEFTLVISDLVRGDGHSAKYERELLGKMLSIR